MEAAGCRLALLCLYATTTGVIGFAVTTSKSNVEVSENDGADLTCSYTADFGSSARVEWKFKNVNGSQSYVVFDGKPTQSYQERVSMYGGSNLRFNKVTRKDNGNYNCEVSESKNSNLGETTVTLTVLVPPSLPMCRIPVSATTGRKTVLKCHDFEASPRPTYRWYKNGTPLPEDPSKVAAFRNLTYKLDASSGELLFNAVTKMDAGSYHCESTNKAGPPQSCKAVKLDVRDQNVGGIVAGVIIGLLLLAFLAFGIWYAYKKGYLPQKTESKPRPSVLYQPPSSYGGGDEEDSDFKQKSSFVV